MDENAGLSLTLQDEPRPEYVTMAKASFSRIVAAAEEIAWDHPEEMDVHEEVGALVYALWKRLSEADGILAEGERIALERVVSDDPSYAGVVRRLNGGEAPAPREGKLMRFASERPVARKHLLVELQTLGYALASVDQSFAHAELDALHDFLGDIERAHPLQTARAR